MTSAVDPAAEFARQCIELTLGVPVEHWDVDGRQGAHDLVFTDSFGTTVAVEVKRVVDPAYRAMAAAAGKTGYVMDARLALSWHVDIEHGRHFTSARRALPDLLVELEKVRWDGGGDWWRLRTINAALRQQLEELGIASAWPHQPTEEHPPGFYLMPDGWGGGVPEMESLPAFVSGLLTSEGMGKLRTQLARATTLERHAFLVIGWEDMMGVRLSHGEERDLPSKPPVLPAGVHGVWVCSSNSSTRLVAWIPGDGWLNGSVPVQPTD